MENIKSTKIRGDLVYNFMKSYNTDVAVYNKYHKDNIKQLDWNDTIKKLNKMTESQYTLCNVAIKKAWKEYYKIIENELNPVIEEILKVDNIKDMW
jgi:uncharacterized FlaG/YvyC family protein